MITTTTCPKCSSPNAYYERKGHDLNLRCRCGYFKVVYTELETITIERNDAGVDVKLPKRGTNLYATLAALASMITETSAGVTNRLIQLGHDFDVSDVSSYLTILRSKGLVVATEIRRGVAGGSTWVLTDACKELLGE
jgi:hypothetical protein